MKIWGYITAAVLTLAVGFGAGYFTRAVAYSRENMQNNIQSKTHNSEQELPDAAQAESSVQKPLPSPSVPPVDLEKETEASAPGDVEIEASPTPDAEDMYYMVKEYFDKIAIYKVYSSGENTLISIVDIDIGTLPEKDRELLIKGIGVKTEEEMLQMLEDYMS